MKEKEILNSLRMQLKKAYAPYSKFRVSAILETSSGKFYTGSNIENSSYGLTICAERVAASCAVKDGYTAFEKLYLMTDSRKPEFPCGACLQFLSEFSSNLRIMTYTRTGLKKTARLSKLLVPRFKL